MRFRKLTYKYITVHNVWRFNGVWTNLEGESACFRLFLRTNESSTDLVFTGDELKENELKLASNRRFTMNWNRKRAGCGWEDPRGKVKNWHFLYEEERIPGRAARGKDGMERVPWKKRKTLSFFFLLYCPPPPGK